MIASLDAFDAGQKYLAGLVGDLEGALMAIEEKDKSWHNQFLDLWASLETILALALDEERQLDEEDFEIVGNATQELRTMISKKIAQLEE